MNREFDIKGKEIIIVGCKNWASKIIDSLSKESKLTKIGESNNCGFTINFEKEEDWDLLKNYLTKMNKKFDALINIGKIAEMDGLKEIPVEKWKSIVSKNLEIIYKSVNAFSNFIKNGGSIVNILEIGSMEGFGGGNVYEAFKKESHVLIKGFAYSLSEKQIRVNALRLGFIETEEVMGAGAKLMEVFKKNAEKETPLNTVGSLKDIENAIVYLISDASRFITGNDIYIDGGLNVKM